MFVEKTLLFVAALVVACVIFSSSASSSMVDALSVTFNNGSTLTLQASYFTGKFSQMQQNGISPGPHDWEMSLVDPSTFNGNCPSALYLAMGKTCDEAKFGTAAYTATPNSDGSGIQIIFKATNGANQWQASLDIVCDAGYETLFSPTNAYTASQPSTDIIVAWTLKSKGACLGAGPTPPPPSGPTVTFNNGSSLTLDNAFFKNTFLQMQQTGLSPNPYDWELSLASPDTFNNLCSTPVYLGQGSKCDQMTFKNAPAATPNSDGSGVLLIYQDTDSLNRKWQASANVICDPRRNMLYSPSNSYDAAQPADTIVISFILTSKGACLNNSNPPSPPPPPSAPTITFFNGSTLTIQEKYFNAQINLQQTGLAPASQLVHFSLATPSMFSGLCSTSVYWALGNLCRQAFVASPVYSATPNQAGDGIQLLYKTTFPNPSWLIAIEVVCDPSAEILYSPSGSYNASQPSTDIILSFRMASKGACLSSMPPSPSPSSGQVVYFNNGSSITLNNFFFTANFPQMTQQGIAPQKDSIGMSLVTPSSFDNTCRNASYISMNKCTGALFDSAPLYVTPNSAQSGLEFVFKGQSQNGLIWQANINVVCDLNNFVLASPTNTYQASAPGSRIILTFNMTSRGACINRN